MRLPGGKVRRGPGGRGTSPQMSPSKAACVSVGLRPSTLQTVSHTVCPCGNQCELHEGKVRRGPGGPGTSPQLSPSKVACASEGLRPPEPQTLPQSLCRYAYRFELHEGKVRRGPCGLGLTSQRYPLEVGLSCAAGCEGLPLYLPRAPPVPAFVSGSANGLNFILPTIFSPEAKQVGVRSPPRSPLHFAFCSSCARLHRPHTCLLPCYPFERVP